MDKRTQIALQRQRRDLLYEEELRRQLPSPGDEMTRTISMWGNSNCALDVREHGVVEHVNREHLFFTLRFYSGLRESYKLPEVGN